MDKIILNNNEHGKSELLPHGAARLLAVLGAGALLLLSLSLLAGNYLVLPWDILWNVFLALIPLALSLAIVWRYGTRKGRVLFWVLAALWLFTLPNAPYMLTDLIHLSRYTFWANGAFVPSVAAWVGLTHLTGSVVLGCCSGFLSLYLVHRLVRSRFGARGGWLFATGACLLCGAGIYIGRFLRFNSWDILTRPLALLNETAARLGAHTLALCLLFAAVTFAGYGLFYVCFHKTHPYCSGL